MNEEILADLRYVAGYANAVHAELVEGRKPTIGFLNRMRDLAEKVQRHFDPKLEEMGNGSS